MSVQMALHENKLVDISKDCRNLKKKKEGKSGEGNKVAEIKDLIQQLVYIKDGHSGSVTSRDQLAS